jgi:hypothetical protein
MKVSLDLHDFSVVNSRLDLLLTLKDRYPGFKVSLFTVPMDRRADFGLYLIRDELLARVKENLDWIQIIPHGFDHHGAEFRNCDYGTMKLKIMPAIEEAFGRDGLPFERGFCAPHWKWSSGTVQALDEAGWWGAVDPAKPHMERTGRFYRYSHNIDMPFVLSADLLKLHGHVYGTSNDLGRCLANLFNVPTDAEWHFVTDFLEEE